MEWLCDRTAVASWVVMVLQSGCAAAGLWRLDVRLVSRAEGLDPDNPAAVAAIEAYGWNWPRLSGSSPPTGGADAMHTQPL